MGKNKKPNIVYFNPFSCTCFILNTKDNLNKFNYKSQKSIMLGYPECPKGYKMHDAETIIFEESIHVKVDKKLEPEKLKLDEIIAYLKDHIFNL